VSVAASGLVLMLRKLELWRPLEDEDRNAVLALPHTIRSLGPSEYIVREGDIATHTCVLLSGFAMRNKIVIEGARQIFAVHIRGDLLDVQNSFLGKADHNVQTLTPCEVAYIPVEAVRQIIFERPRVGKAILYDTLVDAAIFREWIANVGRRDGRTRVAHLLCEFALRQEVAGLAERCSFSFPLTQEQIADCTGLTPIHVNRMLRRLDEAGLVVREKTRTMHIKDWAQLQKVGDFDKEYLHLDALHRNNS
jgi:CRP-like cAMP-binding protein